MRKYLIVFLCLAAAGLYENVALHAADHPMKNIDAFAFGGVGFAGTTSEGEIEFREILARKTALKDFQNILASGSREAKCYALVAIRRLAPKEFDALAAPFKDDTKKVRTISGCIIMELPMNSVVEGIVKGNYDAYPDRKLRP